MIHTDDECTQVEQLTTHMRRELSRMAAAEPSAADSRLRAHFEAELPRLEAEVRAYRLERVPVTHTPTSALTAHVPDDVRGYGLVTAGATVEQAQVQIAACERTMAALRQQIETLSDVVPIDHERLAAIYDEIAVQENLLSAWQSRWRAVTATPRRPSTTARWLGGTGSYARR